MTPDTFVPHCRAVMGEFLRDYDFSYCAAYQRPRGVVVEFRKGDARLFATCEGGSLHVELMISSVEQQQYRRISLNQALWYDNIRELVHGRRSCVDQLDMFVQLADEICAPLLSGIVIDADERYCFRMSKEDWHSHIERQTEGLNRAGKGDSTGL